MTLKPIGLNGTPGTALSNANSGSQQVVTNGGSATYSTDLVAEGTTGAKFIALANALNIARFTAAASNLTMSYGVAFMIPANPARSWTNFASLRASGAPLKANWTAAGTIDIRDQNNANPIAVTGSYTPGKAYWLSIRAKVGTTTTGTFTANVYDLATRALIGTASSSTYNLGTAAITGGDIGVVNGDPSAGDTAYLDLLTFDDGSTTEILPPATSTNYQGVLNLNGTGTLQAAAIAARTAYMALTGTGTLTQATTAATTGTAALAGTGTLEQTATAAGTDTRNAAGIGTLKLTATTTKRAALDVTAVGTLDLATNAQRTAAVAPSGAGTLTLDSRVTHAASLELTADTALDLTTTHAATDTLPITGAAQLDLSGGGSDHHDTLTLDSGGTLTLALVGKQRDITVTAVIAPRKWAATTVARTYAGTTRPRRWDAHADVSP